jgi:hypothetical protein
MTNKRIRKGALNTNQVAREIASLPLEAQTQVRDFVLFLRTRYAPHSPSQKMSLPSFFDEPFVGMWEEREDMPESTDWVRTLRKQNWEPL